MSQARQPIRDPVVLERMEVALDLYEAEIECSLRGVLAPWVDRSLPLGEWEVVRSASWAEASGEGPAEDDG